MTRRPAGPWPVVVIALPAMVAVWSGWVQLAMLCGFGIVHPLPGIWDSLQLNTAITLPVGIEAYGVYALGAWLRRSPVPARARKFARRSAVGALILGAGAQGAVHLLDAAHATRAPWPVVLAVGTIPVVTTGLAAALWHLMAAPAPATRTRPADTTRTADTKADSDPDTTTKAAADKARSEAYRNLVLDHYGRTCACCGETDNLQVDHIDGAAKATRTDGANCSGSTLVRWLIANGYPDGFQAMCGPCNKSKSKGTRCTINHGAYDALTGRTSTQRTEHTAAEIARLRAEDPRLTQADIAERLGITDRTVRRHLAAANGHRP